MWLSSKLAKSIKKHQKQLGVTEMDILCISVAALCHDLGHGETDVVILVRFYCSAFSNWTSIILQVPTPMHMNLSSILYVNVK